MSDEGNTGFTVKEMLVRLETKVDIVLADHENRIRDIEKKDDLIAGGISAREKNVGKALVLISVSIALLAFLSQAVYYATH